jgi:Fic family protein
VGCERGDFDHAGNSFSLPAAPLNNRQRMMMNKLIDDFEGKVTSSKWAKITKCSPDTALRDIEGLIAEGILRKDAAGGRSASYSLAHEQAAALTA